MERDLDTLHKLIELAGFIVNNSKLNYVIKGNVALSSLLINTTKGYDKIRGTVDLDLDLLHHDLDEETVITDLTEVVKKYNPNYLPIIERHFVKGEKSLGIRITDEVEDEDIMYIDLNVSSKSKFTEIDINNIRMNCVDLVYMVADKTKVVSSRKVNRRCKDLLDLYFILTTFDFDGDEVPYSEVEDFSELDEELIYRSYDKMKIICEKPDIEEVLNVIRIYKEPLLDGSYARKKWDHDKLQWVNKGGSLASLF